MYARIGQVHLRLRPRDPGNPVAGRPIEEIFQQRGLAYPGLSTHGKSRALASTHAIKQPRQLLSL
jgi:hypothetical protein